MSTMIITVPHTFLLLFYAALLVRGAFENICLKGYFVNGLTYLYPCFSDCAGESIEDLKRFAHKFLSDGHRVKPYFWQYNAQSRGPKARRLCSSVTVEDSHVVPDFADPVFCTSFPYQLSHSGKARQGDGNDPRPDPQELLAIGSRIWRLETEFKSVSAEPIGDASTRSLMNQRKNQLASKICRLKKKALHAANKIKLDGLKQEHGWHLVVCAI